jgi:hypothetical protein
VKRTGRLPATLRVGMICLAVVILADVLIRHERGISGDEPFYDRMASHPGGPHNFPYAYRVGVPWLVHVLPFAHVASFTLIAWLAIATSAAALYALLGEFDVAERLSIPLVIGFILSPPLLVVLIRHGRSIDPVSILVMTLGTLFIVRRQRLALLITVLVGTTIRESSLFLIPFAYAVWASSPFDPEALRDTVLLAVAPLIAYVVIRTSITAVGKIYIPGYNGPFFTERWDIIRTGFSSATLPLELRRLVLTYGPIWLAAPFALRDLPFARRGLVLVFMCVAAMTFAFDWGRIIFLAAPVFYVAAAWAVRDRRRFALALVIGLFALDLGYGIYMQAYGVAHGIESSVFGVPVY